VDVLFQSITCLVDVGLHQRVMALLQTRGLADFFAAASTIIFQREEKLMYQVFLSKLHVATCSRNHVTCDVIRPTQLHAGVHVEEKAFFSCE
jgi:hypothetical protein